MKEQKPLLTTKEIKESFEKACEEEKQRLLQSDLQPIYQVACDLRQAGVELHIVHRALYGGEEGQLKELLQKEFKKDNNTCNIAGAGFFQSQTFPTAHFFIVNNINGHQVHRIYVRWEDGIKPDLTSSSHKKYDMFDFNNDSEALIKLEKFMIRWASMEKAVREPLQAPNPKLQFKL